MNRIGEIGRRRENAFIFLIAFDPVGQRRTKRVRVQTKQRKAKLLTIDSF